MIKHADEFGPFDPQTLSCPHAFWTSLRHTAPIKRIAIPRVQRPVYLVSRRADIQRVASDPQTCSSVVPSDVWRWGDLGPTLQPRLTAQGWNIVHTIASADPPLHGLYRKLVNDHSVCVLTMYSTFICMLSIYGEVNHSAHTLR